MSFFGSLIPSLITGGTSLVGGLMSGLFGSSSQKSANETNISLQRETNALQKELAEKEAARQDKWNERSYEEYWKQREYDSIANQKARYESAGINPYFALGNMEAGQAAGSTPSPSASPSLPSMSVAHVDPFDPTDAIMQGVEGIGRGVSSYFENNLIKQQADNQAIRNITQLSRDIAELYDKMSDARKKGKETSYYESQIKTLEAMRDPQLEQLRLSNVLTKEQANEVKASSELKKVQRQGQELSNKYQEWFNEFSKKHGEAQLKQMKALTAQAFAAANLSNKQAALATVQKLVAEAQKKGIDIDNEQKQELFKLTKEMQQINIKAQEIQNEKNAAGLGLISGRYNPLGLVTNILGPVLGAAAGAYFGTGRKAAGAAVNQGPKLLNSYGEPLFHGR